MKETRLVRAAVCFFLAAAMFSCKTLQEDTSQTDGAIKSVKADKTESFSYSASHSVFEVTPETLSVTISGELEGKHLYLIKANPTESVIDSSLVRTVMSMNDVAVAGQEEAESRRARTGSRKRFFDDDIITHFAPPQDFDPSQPVLPDSRSATGGTTDGDSLPRAGSPRIFSVGDTRLLYVDANAAISEFEQKTAVLQAVGEHCYVWVVDVERNRAAELYAKDFQRNFDSMYRMITNVYGRESDQIYVYNGRNFSLEDMASYSDTGCKVNIVLSRFVSTGTVGYFYCKDYYQGCPGRASDARSYSNSGKFVYINTYYVGTETSRKMAYSTLAHEFQHMIMFGQKNIRCGAAAADWFNEMMSMVCEDLMQKQLEVPDSQSPKNRLGRFAASYYLSGASEFISVDGSRLPSYAMLYAFGAFLARTYGGAGFINKIMQNDFANEEAITAAVRAVSRRETAFSEILRAFVLSFVKEDEDSLNRHASDSPFFTGLVDSQTQYDYPLAPIDMEQIMQKGSMGSYGMKFFQLEEACVTLRPNGFTLHDLGVLTEASVSITFSGSGAAGQKFLLVVAG